MYLLVFLSFCEWSVRQVLLSLCNNSQGQITWERSHIFRLSGVISKDLWPPLSLIQKTRSQNLGLSPMSYYNEILRRSTLWLYLTWWSYINNENHKANWQPSKDGSPVTVPHTVIFRSSLSIILLLASFSSFMPTVSSLSYLRH